MSSLFPAISDASRVSRSQHRARVSSIEEVAPAHYQLRLEAPDLASVARPGQFVHVLTSPNAEGWIFDPLLRRAFSIMSVQSEAVKLLFRVGGRGTQALAKAREGDEIDIIGPLGRPFDTSPLLTPVEELSTDAPVEMFHVKQSARFAIMVGGGVGVPPLVYLSQTLAATGVNVHSIIGARSASEVIGWHELSAVCQQVLITTDDGSRGHSGRVTDLLGPLIEELSSEEAGPIARPIVYACGPLPMLRAVAQVCQQAQVRCQVSLEENMPCGIGVCNGCVVRTRQPFANDVILDDGLDTTGANVNRIVGDEWSPYRAYRRVCVEGPACWADEIDWERQG